jgi:hypothetical protein
VRAVKIALSSLGRVERYGPARSARATGIGSPVLRVAFRDSPNADAAADR